MGKQQRLLRTEPQWIRTATAADATLRPYQTTETRLGTKTEEQSKRGMGSEVKHGPIMCPIPFGISVRTTPHQWRHGLLRRRPQHSETTHVCMPRSSQGRRLQSRIQMTPNQPFFHYLMTFYSFSFHSRCDWCTPNPRDGLTVSFILFFLLL